MTFAFQSHVLSAVTWLFDRPFPICFMAYFRQDAPFSHNTYVRDRRQTDRRTDTTQARPLVRLAKIIVDLWSIDSTFDLAMIRACIGSDARADKQEEGHTLSDRTVGLLIQVRHKMCHNATWMCRQQASIVGVRLWMPVSGWVPQQCSHTNLVDICEHSWRYLFRRRFRLQLDQAISNDNFQWDAYS